MRRRRWILARAVVREALPGLVLALSVTTFLLLIRSLFTLADLLMSRNVAVGDVAELLVLAIPHVVALTLPMSALFAVLTTAGRLTSDSEVIAAEACGIRARTLLRPFLALGAVLTVVDLGLTIVLLPSTNRAITEKTAQVALSGASAAVEARFFEESFPGFLVYVDQIERETGHWKGVLLFDLSVTTEERLVTADAGVVTVDPADGTTWLNLTDTATYVIKPERPASTQRTANRELSIRLTPPAAAVSHRQLGVRATDSPTLLRRAGDPHLAREERLDAVVELHKRVAIPLATLVLVLVGFPLGLRNRRGGKGFGLTVSVGLVLAYYVLLNNGTLLARSGTLPAGLGVWLANLALAAVGLALVRRASAAANDRPSRLGRAFRVAASFLARLRGDATAGRLRGNSAAWRVRRLLRPRGAFEAPLPQFLGMVDAHLLRQCLAFLAAVLVAVVGISITVKLTDQIDDIQRNAVPWLTVATYYWFSLPQILHDILPISFLIAFLATATLLDRSNEATALKASGISLTRVAAPLLAVAALCGLGLFLLSDFVMQQSNRDAQRLEDLVRGRRVARSYRATDRPWLFLPDGRTLVNFLQYDPDTGTLVRPSVYVFGTRLNLRAHCGARRAVYQDGEWRAEGGWVRRWLADGSSDFDANLAVLPLPVEPQYFGREYRRPSQMSFRELREYIDLLRTAGYRVDRQLVQLHLKLAYPASVFLLAWLALPFAFGGGPRGTVRGIALALVLGMAYFGLTALLTKLGETSLLPPALAAWTPSVLFALLAANRHTTLRT